jgi:hypothetical protein
LTDSVLLMELGLSCPEGDVLGHRAFADELLTAAVPISPTPHARLLLTALLLHLSSRNGPSPTCEDLASWLEAGRRQVGAFAPLAESSIQLLGYAHAELLSLGSDSRSVALEQCLSAAQLGSSIQR